MDKKNLKIAIVGSRSFDDYECLCQVIAKHLSPSDKIDCVISGGAKGADSLSERYAREHGYPIKIYPAEWELHGPAAGYMRNIDIIKACDICFAIWDGGSKGTFDAMRLCEELGKPYHIYYFKKPVQGQIYQQARQLSITSNRLKNRIDDIYTMSQEDFADLQKSINFAEIDSKLSDVKVRIDEILKILKV